MKQILIALLVVVPLAVACGGKQAPSSSVDNTASDKSSDGDKPGVGKAGDVCHIGRQHVGSAVAVDCGPGLNCCYPCGIDGCDSVCMAGECPTGMP